jgi:hypothetical protein
VIAANPPQGSYEVIVGDNYVPNTSQSDGVVADDGTIDYLNDIVDVTKEENLGNDLPESIPYADGISIADGSGAPTTDTSSTASSNLLIIIVILAGIFTATLAMLIVARGQLRNYGYNIFGKPVEQK